MNKSTKQSQQNKWTKQGKKSKKKYKYKPRFSLFKKKPRMRFIARIPHNNFFFSFGNLFLEREMAFFWRRFDKDFQREWKDIGTEFYAEDAFVDKDFFYYDVDYNQHSFERTKVLASSIAIDTYSKMNADSEDEHGFLIPDAFHFDMFFAENSILLLIFLLFFSSYWFSMLYTFLALIYIFVNFSFIENENEIYDIFDTEHDLSHYTYAEFEFVKTPALVKIFFASSSWCKESSSFFYRVLKKI
jgi:hypothetical protein